MNEVRHRNRFFRQPHRAASARVLFGCLLLVCLLDGYALPAKAQGAAGSVAGITVKGNNNVAKEAIQAVLRQKTGQPFSDTAAEADRQAVQEMGYFSAVTLQTDRDPSNNVLETYTVVENPKVTQIAVTGNTAVTTTKLLTLIHTQPGTVLNTNTLAQDIQSIVGYYRDQGYRASISEDINIDPTSGVLSIPVIEARVSGIKITGNTKTKPRVITREFRTKVGDVYNENLFRKDLTRIFNLGLFDSVGPADISTPDVGKIALAVPVTERRTGQVSVSLGYSSREKLVGIASLAETNFRGMGQTASLSWTVGGVQSQSSVEASFGDPYIDKYHDGFNIDAFNRVVYRFNSAFFSGAQNGSDSQYIERRKGAALTVSRPVSDYTTAFLSSRYESVHTNDASVPLADSFIRQNSDITGLGTRFVTDNRDNNFNPAAGVYNALSVETVSATIATVGNSPTPLAPGRRAFMKYGLDLRRYFSLQGPRRKSITEQKRVLAFRLLGGFTKADVPFSEQYFLGGADTLRGYDDDRFWGNNLFLLNTELRIPVASSVTGVLFTDVGDAWGSIYQGVGLQQHTSLSINQSIGVGLRVTTPLGPIRLDYGVGRNGGKTSFSIGQSF